jgi:uncharacterized protein (TIRG00374 family)
MGPHGKALRKFLLKYVLSTALGAVMVWVAFRGEDWSDFGRRLATVDVGLLTLYLLLFTLGHVVRMARWGVLVRALGPVKWGDVMGAGAIGYMAIMVLPLRLGEFVRPVLIRGKGGVSASGAMATVVVERVIDGLLFVALFFVFMSLLPQSDRPAVEAVKLAGYIAGAIFLAALVVLVAGYARRRATVEFIARVGDRIHAGLTRKAVRLLGAFLDGLRVLPDRRRIFWFIVFTAIYWATQGIGMTVMAWAAQIPDVGFVGGFVLLAVLVVGIMAPGGPGMTGTFELSLAAGFSLLDLNAESQKSLVLYTVMLHATQLIIQVVVGVGFIVLGRMGWRGVVEATEGPSPLDEAEDEPEPLAAAAGAENRRRAAD